MNTGVIEKESAFEIQGLHMSAIKCHGNVTIFQFAPAMRQQKNCKF